jgi:hypothetical protein
VNGRAYWGASCRVSKAALETLAQVYAAETVNTKLRVNIIDPRRGAHENARIRQTPGEDPMTLPTPENIAPRNFVELLCCRPAHGTAKLSAFNRRTDSCSLRNIKPDRHARHIEIVTQPIHQIPLIPIRQRSGFGHPHRECRRTHIDLRHILKPVGPPFDTSAAQRAIPWNFSQRLSFAVDVRIFHVA